MEVQILLYLLSLSFFSFLFFIHRKFVKKSNKKFPPGPPSYPIIGHLHLLKAPVYRCLQNLSNTYGPIFALKFGSIRVLIVSSPQLLEECFSKNDIIFADRPKFLIPKHLSYNFSTMGSANYGPHWRNLRRVSALEFFSTNRLNAYLAIRKEETVSLLKNMYGGDSSLSYKRVQMRSRLSELSFNIAMRMASGKRYFGADVEDLDEAKRFREIISETVEVSGAGQPNDFFKFLQWIDFQDFEKKLVRLQKRTDAFLQNLVDEIRNKRKASGTEGQNSRTYIDTMLGLQESEPEYYTDDLIKGNTMLLLIGGTDTTSLTIEWAMSLLLNHPEVIEKARAEIDKNIGHNNLVQEGDLSKLPYLQCIMNETLRLFPVAPLLVPHISSDDCIVGGFDIPRGTVLMANVWALHRDPNVWDDPTSFKPERFEDSQTQGYKFLPFGMGRRQCPGVGLANRMVNLSLAALIQCFEWARVDEELVNLSEGQGITMPKEKPLEFMCKPRDQMINILSQL